MKLNVLAIAMLLSTIDFAVTCFPALSRTNLKDKEQIEQNEPDFYR
jgi:hypothetical protein